MGLLSSRYATMAPAPLMHTHAYMLNVFHVNKIITASYIIDDDKARVSAGRLHHKFVDIIYQRLALKRLPHRKCMRKL